MDCFGIANSAQELMAYWQRVHDAQESVVINNYGMKSNQVDCVPFFADALELLCQAVENGSFYKPLYIDIRGRTAIRAVLDAVLLKRLTNIKRLELSQNQEDAASNITTLELSLNEEDAESDVSWHEEAKILSDCIENESLNHMEYFVYDCNNNKWFNNVVISALATGKAPNLVEVNVGGHYVKSSKDEIVQAVADRKLPRLKRLKYDHDSLFLTAQELMAEWQEHHDTGGSVEINKGGDWSERGFIYYPFFADALELLCQAMERGSFHKPVDINVEGRTDIGAVLEAILKKRLTNVRRLQLSKENFRDGDYSAEAQFLSQCLKNGTLKHLEALHIECSYDHNDIILSAVATGEAPELEEVVFFGFCGEATRETMSRAMVDKKLPKLKLLPDSRFPLKRYCEILRLPQEFTDKNNSDILAFLRERWEYGEVQLSTAKVILTGPSTVGKTCLVNCLKGNAFAPDPGSTNTMEIGKKIEEGGLELLFHDFGGQRVYTTSHQLFLKTIAVFLILWDRLEGTGGDSAAHQYARDVLDANPNAKLMFITTKGDLEGRNTLTADEQVELKKRYGNAFIGYWDVSAKTNIGVCELLAAIKAAATGFANVLIPKTYDDLRKSLTKVRDDQDKWYVTKGEWNELCQEADITGKDRTRLVLRLFQDMGEVVWLSTGYIVVKPSVLVGILSRVVTVDVQYKENARGGYLRHDELEQVWIDYPQGLHEGFLNLIHGCDMGFPVRDETHEYRATFIPAMLVESSGVEIRQKLNQLLTDFPNFEAGPEIVVDLSNLSNQFWTKLLVKLRFVVVFGGWWANGCIVVDTFDADDADHGKSIRSFGVVLWDSEKYQVSILTYGCFPANMQLLRRRALDALLGTLKSFPGVTLERLQMNSFSNESSSEVWSRRRLLHSPLVMSTFERHGAQDVAEWVMKVKEGMQAEAASNAGKQTEEDSSFGYFLELLEEDSGASNELLSYLILTHQRDMLKKGCERGRLDLSALWLIYDDKGRRVAYPFCPHLHPKKIRVKKDMEVNGVSEVDLHKLTEDQIELKSLLLKIINRLNIGPPRFKAELLGIVWHACDEEYLFNIRDETSNKFQPVQVNDIEVFVHESDQLYFTNPCQVQAITEVTEKAKEAIRQLRGLAMDATQTIQRASTCANGRLDPRSERVQQSSTEDNEAWLFEEEPFLWLCLRFRDGKRRKECMESVLGHVPVTINIGNEVKNKIRGLVKDYQTFYPKVIISYSTGYRKDFDLVDSAGPGLMLSAAVIQFLFENGYPCYSDIMTPVGRNWEEYMLRLEEAEVMIVLMTIPFFLSVNCLLEVGKAVNHGLELIPIRCDQTSVSGVDIARDTAAMWPDEELKKYAYAKRESRNEVNHLMYLKSLRSVAVETLSSISSLPVYGTLWNEPTATQELVNRLGEMV